MIKVIHPGIATSIQDGGRWGYQSNGVSVGGAMDKISYRLANILTGNDENAPALEITQSHVELYFEKDAVISFCGGGLQPEFLSHLAFAEVPSAQFSAIPLWHPVYIPSDSIVIFQKPLTGFRLYMAVSGGFKADEFLGSRSTDLKCKAGGVQGRHLRKDDVLISNAPADVSENIFQFLKGGNKFKVNDDLLPKILKKEINILAGPEWELISEPSLKHFLNDPFKLTNEYSRMGYRLQSAPLEMIHKTDLISTAISRGFVQLTPNGQTILLMNDCQTIGGYPRIAKIIEADLSSCGQFKPGDEISFTLMSLQEAEKLYLNTEEQLQKIKGIISDSFS